MEIEKGFDIDSIIHKLLIQPESRIRQEDQLEYKEIQHVCRTAKTVLKDDPSLYQLQSPINVIGSLFGNFRNLKRILEYGQLPPESKYLFLGNFCGIDKQAIECWTLVLALKIKYPHHIYILRGPKELFQQSRHSLFFDICKIRYTIKVWKYFKDVFDCLPYAATIDNIYFWAGSGIPPKLDSFEDINEICSSENPTLLKICEYLQSGIFTDNSIPHSNSINDAQFGPEDISEFCIEHGISLVITTNNPQEGSYQLLAEKQYLRVNSYSKKDPGYKEGVFLMISEPCTYSMQTV